VGDEAHVGLVDPHAEGDGRDHDQAFLVEETLLVIGAQLVGQARVVRQCRKALLAEERSQVIDLLARHAIDNASIAAALG